MKHFKYSSSLMIVFVLLITGCKKSSNYESNDGGGGNNNNSDVRVTTYTPQNITATTAKCGGDVIVTQGLSLSGLGICWSTESNPTADDAHLYTTNWNTPYVCTIIDLNPCTNYHIRAYALRGLEYYYGDDVSFTTLDGELPTVTTSEVINITTNSALGGGIVMSNGGVPIIEQGICWSTQSYPTIDDYYLSSNTGLEQFTITMTNLEHSTLYYVRAYVKNYYGISYGSQVSFTTQTAELPIVATSEVTDIMANTAKAGGVVLSEGSLPVTERGICWSINSNPTIDDTHISSGSGLGTFNINISYLEQNTMYYIRAYAVNYYGVSYGSQVSFVTLNPPPGGSYNGYDYVDLGLPSGTLWATCNVGSNGYGDYFAWGETEPKNIYNWSNYKYCNGSFDHLTKYCTRPDCGVVDNLTVLQAIDDAASVNWGDGWRTPTIEQWIELINNTTHIGTWQNDMGGILLTSSNGNSLFLPAAHYYTNDPPNWIGTSGCYSSSSLLIEEPNCNRTVSFNTYYNTINGNQINRCVGMSVRPVLAVQ